jgi:LGFP repeat
MFAFLKRIHGQRIAKSFTEKRGSSVHKRAQPRRLEVENLEERMVLSGGINLSGSFHQPTNVLQVLTDPIAAEYNATANETDLNGHIVQQVLGSATSGEIDVPGVPGARMETFQNGAIYYSPDTGAHVVLGAIYSKYLSPSVGGPAGYGLPMSDEANVPGVPMARFSSFQNGGDIYYSSNSGGAHEVHGAINAYYQSLGGPTSYLGLPTSDEKGPVGSRFNYFQDGEIVCTPQGPEAEHDFLGDERYNVPGQPEITDLYQDGNQLTIEWTGQGNHDKYILGWSENGGPSTQVVFGGGGGGSFTLTVTSGAEYTFTIQWGDSSWFGLEYDYSPATMITVQALPY